MSEDKLDAVVLGAGVIGLSIAQELVRRGRKVAVVARDLPEDVDSGDFASPWAGANWASYAATDREKKWDTETYHYFDKLSKEAPELCRLTDVVYTYQEESDYVEPWYSSLVRNYRHLSAPDIPAGWNHAYAFQNYCLDPPAYLAHLCAFLASHGVRVLRKRLSSLDQAYCTAAGPVDLVVNATGLGARGLLGVNDEAVFPARGQTVLTYIIPRPGAAGYVILGGTFEAHNYSLLPDPAQATRILQECYALAPELGAGKGWEAIEVVSHNVGLRPCRQGGARVELERRKIGSGAMGPSVKGTGREVGVVHAYGIGPAGYQASYGIALEAADLVEEYLAARS